MGRGSCCSDHVEDDVSSNVRRYGAHVRKFDRTSGSSCWSLFYQAFERLRRERELASHTALVAQPATAPPPHRTSSHLSPMTHGKWVFGPEPSFLECAAACELTQRTCWQGCALETFSDASASSLGGRFILDGLC